MRTLLLVGLLTLFGALALQPAAAVAAPVTQLDEQGPDDVTGSNAQRDLNQHTADFANSPTSIDVGWQWDETGFTGSNTGDACALFDTDNDGNVNSAVCVTIAGTPATFQSFSVWTCSDNKVDRCTSPNAQIPGLTTTCTVSPATDPFAGVLSHQTTEGLPDSAIDTAANCTVDLAAVGAGAKLVNTCAYPSASVNSAPDDCVLFLREGLLVIQKVATPNDPSASFNFFLDGAATPIFTAQGSQTSDPIPVRTDIVSHSLTETPPPGWILASSSCTNGTPASFNVGPGDTVTCTFNNTFQSQTPTVTTKIHNGSNHTTDVQNTTIALGSTIHDEATVAGVTGFPTPTGTVDFTFYTSGDCTTGSTASGADVALVSGVAHPSASQGPLAAGSYSFKAHYDGDGVYNSADGPCESVTVGKAASTATTEIHLGSNHTTDVQNTTIALGSTIHDEITVAGNGSFTPTGTADFTFYSSADCDAGSGDENVVTTQSNVALSGGSAESSQTAALAAGSYSYLAHYDGDGNYNADDAPCENVTVGKAASTATTEIHLGSNHTTDVQNTTIALGSTIHDEITVAGNGSFTPTGTADFTFYSSADCDAGSGDENVVTTKSNVALSGGSAESSQTAALAAGSYSYLAHYDGDGNYNADDAPCENVTVGKAASTATTEIHLGSNHTTDVQNTTIALGSTIHDEITVAGNGSFTPTGTADFTFYSSADCDAGSGDENVVTTQSNVALSGGSAESSQTAALAAGSYSYLAHYDGDGNYNADDAPCENVTVGKAASTATTEIHLGSNHTTDVQNTTIALGSTIHDEITVAGNGSFTPTGTADFTFYSSADCDAGSGDENVVTTQSNVALSGGSAESSQTAALAAGSYSYLAHYDGDGNYNADDAPCENVTVGKAASTATTEIHLGSNHTTDVQNTTIALGSTIHDEITVAGNGSFTPTGTADFTFYSSADCDAGSGDENVVTTQSNVALSGGSAESSQTAALAAGSYSYLAHYDGDGNYNADDAPCENVTVGKAASTATTEIHLGSNHTTDVQNTTIALGSTIHDEITVAGNGSFTPTGTADFTFYSSADCDAGSGDENVVTTQSNVALSGGSAESSQTAALAAGSYSYLAHYDGDGNYNADDAPCENVTVGKAASTATTEIHLGSNHTTDVQNTTIALGSTIHDEITVAGNGSFTPTGTADFTFYSSADCDAGSGDENVVTTQSNVALSGGSAESSQTAALAAGSYSYLAHYDGDGNYNADDAPCENVTVGKAASTATTEIHLGSNHTTDVQNTTIALGSTIHDEITVAGNGSFTPTGTADFTFYSSADCDAGSGDENVVTTQSNVALSGGSAESSQTAALAAGSYSYLAHYDGDGNYNADDAPCENVTVGKAASTATTEIHLGSNHTTDVQNTTIALGSTIHDEITVAGNGSFTPTGTADFTFYSSADCDAGSGDENVVTTQSNVALSGGSAESSQTAALAAGSYSYLAHYDGDGNYNADDAPCENVTVGKAASTATTEIHLGSNHTTDVQNTTIALGSTIHDEITVAGNGSFTPTGTADFTFYSSADCDAGSGDENVVTTQSNVALSGGSAESSQTAALAAGSYSYLAHYDGDGNYNADDAPCENVTVGKADATATTEIHLGSNHTTDVQDTTIPLGSSIHDEANVAGVTGIAVGGNVTFTFYANGTCEGTGSGAGSAGVSGGTAHPSATRGPLSAGAYSFKASYNGDANYRADDAPCEKVTVDKADATATTEIHLGSNHTTDVQDTTIPLGSSIHDEANVAGVSAVPVGGNVTFTFYTNGTCEGTGTSAGSAAVSGGTAHPSDTKGPLGAGAYSFKASYNGDANYRADDAPCEKVTVDKADSTATTEIHLGSNHTTDVQDTTIPLGSSIHDEANVAGVSAVPVGGNVTFTFYTNGTCEGTGTSAGSAAVSGGTAHPSDTKGPLGAGAYSFKASYNGDANYRADDAPCEKVTVDKADSTATTEIHLGSNHTTDVQDTTIPLGSSIHDEANVAGVSAVPVGGNVTFTFYTNGTCEGTGTSAGSAAVSGGTAHPSDTKGPLGAGAYSFKASYNGDANYRADDAPCEKVTVDKADPTATTEIHLGSNHTTDVQNTTIPLGSSVHDKANVQGVTGIPVTGNVTFTWYTNGTCEGSGTGAGTVTISGWSAHPSDTKGPLGAGRYSFKARYNGDSNYRADDAHCETLTVAKGNSSVTTEIHNGNDHATDVTAVPAGSTVHDKANLGGQVTGFAFGGNVTFTFFTNGTCQGTGTGAGTIAVSGGAAHPSNNQGPLATGSYSFRARYNGDPNYNGSTSPCEPLKVYSITTSLSSTTGQSGPKITIAQNGTVSDVATLENAPSNAGGNVTYKVYTDSACTTLLQNAGTKAVGSNNVAGASDQVTFNQLGTYYWVAVYSGNGSVAGGVSKCGDEVVTVITPSLARTPGYWKNHEAHTTSLLPIKLGNHTVDTFSKATAVFNAMTCGTAHPNSAVGCLAGHLLAGMLNIKNLSAPCIQPVIEKANAFLRGEIVTYAGFTATGVNYTGPAAAYPLTIDQRNLALTMKNAIDKYNNRLGC